MDARIENVLIHVIEDYVRTAEPVSSSAVVEKHRISMSSATVRNWFALLEEEGFLIQPHASAGRIPSPKAYMWYVERLGSAEPTAAERRLVTDALDGEEDIRTNAKRFAKACADYVGSAILVGTNESDAYYTGLTSLFSQPEFRDWGRVVSIGSVLDRLDRDLAVMRKHTFAEPTALIGTDCPLGEGFAAVVLTLPRRILVSVFGPLRMDYKKARNVLAAASYAMDHMYGHHA